MTSLNAMRETWFNRTSAARAGRGVPARILLACMPKSGSTFLSDVISALPEFKRAKFVRLPTAGAEEELDEDCIRLAGRGHCIAQQHVVYNGWTAKMCKDYRLKPVVLVRSLPDAIVSRRDHIRHEGGFGPYFSADPFGATRDDAELEAMIARFVAPWYVNFYMSWRSAPDALMISYEETIADPARIVRRIVDFAGATVDDRAIAAAVAAVRDRRASRFNVGVVGRGAALSPGILRDVVGLFDFFPEAADDPYVKGVRAQAEAALAGRVAPPLASVAVRPPPASPASAAPCRPAGRRLVAAVRRYGYQITLISVGLLYWVWPEDLIPDDRWYGHIDDAVFLTVLAFLAGRVTRRTPGLRDLPAYIGRAVRRRLRAIP